MAEMIQREREPDPQRLTTYRTNTDYKMENGLILRLHQAPSVIWLELLSPPTTNLPNLNWISLGRVARLQSPGERSQTAVERRRAAFQRAQRLQPSTVEELAAIYKTVEAASPATPQAAASSSGAPVAPVPKSKARSRSKLRPLSS